jgi:hypothetical protein
VAARARDPIGAGVLARLAHDDARPAEVAADVVEWCIDLGGTAIEEAVLEATERDGDATTDASEAIDLSLHGRASEERRFERWCETVAGLPRRQTRVLTWPIVTVFGFVAHPDRHIFLKPNVTRVAAREYDFDFQYASRPNWSTYASLLDFAARVLRDQRDLGPRDMIDLQSFIWVQGSDEYEE